MHWSTGNTWLLHIPPDKPMSRHPRTEHNHRHWSGLCIKPREIGDRPIIELPLKLNCDALNKLPNLHLRVLCKRSSANTQCPRPTLFLLLSQLLISRASPPPPQYCLDPPTDPCSSPPPTSGMTHPPVPSTSLRRVRVVCGVCGVWNILKNHKYLFKNHNNWLRPLR
jgi:hypothetical protein